LILIFRAFNINQKAMKIQIIGKVSGLNRHDVWLKFLESEQLLTAQGYDVINPMRIVPENTEWTKAIIICLRSVIDAEAIAIQPDWYMSKGARLEYLVAAALELKEIKL
jgi:hypothetical protein